MAYGSLTIFDTIGARRAAANDYIGLYNADTLYQQLQIFLDAHNRIMALMTEDLVEPTTERFLTWGSNDQVQMQEGDEFSRPDLQKVTVSPTMMAFPLKLKQVAYGVTRMFMETKTVGDLEQVVTAAVDADLRDRLKEIRQALFNPVNNLTYKDRLVDGITLPVRALLNADGVYIPPDSFGNTFDPATHTHFLGTASFVESDLQALITTVVEHYNTGAVRVYINRAEEDAVRAFSDFKPYFDVRITPGVNQDRALGTPLDILNIYNRPIGIFKEAEIWVKPWMPAGYLFAYNTQVVKPLALRTRASAGTVNRGDLRIAAQVESYPLMATYMEREYGIGVYERQNGACLDTTHSSYAAPPTWTL